ncbi:unnamed protein product [Vitrella brassicaformis CCMP3155]|uniref:Uncharacterized protein n=1 Tax=Vitrella brassicaformis (strain CCMP3155) TaxID=1169540 RepID=A0A0G4EUK1_VITBC|nr:unnamed protein product [Vitrella brassicaformis CCMP3155]|eukprot:CEM01901.1 unnamed protein product [Vitrella brassicaformis CCMP3155]
MKKHAEPSSRFRRHDSDNNASPDQPDAAQDMMQHSRSGDQHPAPAPVRAIGPDEQDEDREFLGIMPSHPGPSHDDSTPLAAIAPSSASDASPLPLSLPSPTHHPAAEAVYTHPPTTRLMQQMAGLTDEGWQMLRHIVAQHAAQTHHEAPAPPAALSPGAPAAPTADGATASAPHPSSPPSAGASYDAPAPPPSLPSHPVMTGSSRTDGGTSSREGGGQHEGSDEWQRPDEGDDEEDDWASYDWGEYEARQHLRVANSRLRKELRRARGELRRARGKTAVCESRVEELRRLLVAYEHEHEDQEADSQLCATLQSELNKELEAVRSELTTARREHHKELMEVKYELWGLEEAHRDLNAAMEQATRRHQAELHEHKAQCEELESRLDLASRRRRELSDDVNQRDDAIRRLVQEKGELGKALAAKTQELERLQTAHRGATTATMRLANELRLAKDETAPLRLASSLQAPQRRQLQGAWSGLQAVVRLAMRASIARLQNRLAEQDEELNEMQAAFHGDVEELQGAHERELQAVRDTLQETRSQLRDARTSLEVERIESEETISRLRQTVSAMRMRGRAEAEDLEDQDSDLIPQETPIMPPPAMPQPVRPSPASAAPAAARPVPVSPPPPLIPPPLIGHPPSHIHFLPRHLVSSQMVPRPPVWLPQLPPPQPARLPLPAREARAGRRSKCCAR